MRSPLLFLTACVLQGDLPAHAAGAARTFETGDLRVSVEGYEKAGRFVANGVVRTTYGNGQAALVGAYREGAPTGTWTQYYENGKTKTRSSYKKGKLDGRFYRYYDDGQLASLETYDDGRLDGKAAYYLKGKRLNLSMTYADGSPVRTMYYDPGGTPRGYDAKSNRILVAGKWRDVPFRRVCYYDRLKQRMQCDWTRDAVASIQEQAVPPEVSLDFIEHYTSVWEDLGLQGNVLVACARGAAGIEDPAITNSWMPTAGAPSTNLPARAGDACEAGGTGGGGGAPLAERPEQAQIDHAVSTMDAMVASCRDNTNPLIADGGVDFGLLVDVAGLIVDLIGLGFEIGDRWGSDVFGNFGDVMVYKNSDMEYFVEVRGERLADVTDRLGGGYTVTVTYDDNIMMESETCEFTAAGELVGCTWVDTDGNTHTEDPQGNFYDGSCAPACHKKAASAVACAKDSTSELCKQAETKPPPPANPDPAPAPGEPDPDAESKCDRMRSHWERLKAECEASNYQSYNCVEFVRRMNNCAGDITVAMPTPDGDLYFGCDTGDDDAAAQATCEQRRWIWVDNGNQDTCEEPSNLTPINPGTIDLCGPRTQPGPDTECNPAFNVPPEQTPGTSPVNPIAFVNPAVKTSSDALAQRRYLRQVELSQASALWESGFQAIGDEALAKGLPGGQRPAALVFVSASSKPSVAYVSDLARDQARLVERGEVRLVDIDQNPALRTTYGVRYAPSTVILNGEDRAQTYVGVMSADEVLEAMR